MNDLMTFRYSREEEVMVGVPNSGWSTRNIDEALPHLFYSPEWHGDECIYIYVSINDSIRCPTPWVFV
jgi:hypothetical protein